MISRKVNLLSIVVGAAAMIATPALASTAHKRAPLATEAYASADKAYGANAQASSGNTVVRWDGRMMGGDPDANVRFQLMLDAFANEN